MPDRSLLVGTLVVLMILAPGVFAADPYTGPLAQVFQVDFRQESFDVQSLALVGGHAEELVHAEPSGLRVQMPAGMGNPETVGIKPRFRVRGDFDISAEFEILQADKPTDGYGIGAQMSIETDSPTKEAATAEWTFTPGKDGVRFISTRIIGQPDGKRDYRVQSLAANRRAGTLRLVRTGTSLRASYRDEGETRDRSLPPVELGTEDVTTVRLAANTGISDHPVEIRLKSLTIAADALPGWAGAPAGSGTSGTGPSWRPILIGLTVMAFIGGLLGLWQVVMRSGRHNRPSSSEAEEPAARWDDDLLGTLEAQAREYARSHPDSELFYEPGYYQFSLKAGVLEGPAVVWWKVAVDELKKPGQSWDEIRRQLPKRYRGRSSNSPRCSNNSISPTLRSIPTRPATLGSSQARERTRRWLRWSSRFSSAPRTGTGCRHVPGDR